MIVQKALFEACRRLITVRAAVRKKIEWIFKRRIFFVSAATALGSEQALHKTEASAEVFAVLGSVCVGVGRLMAANEELNNVFSYCL